MATDRSVPVVFGEVLREFREMRSMSQEELAEASGLSRPHISRLENGRNDPGLSVVFKLAKGLHCAPEEMVRRARERVLQST